MDYEETVSFFQSLCYRYGLPTPTFVYNCQRNDTTTAEEVTIGYEIHTEADVCHLFGHWVCDLHAESKDDVQDKVADMIGHLLMQAGKGT